MTMFTERLPHSGGFLIAEASGFLSRESVTIAHSKALYAGAVLGRITLGAATVTAGTNTGNGTAGSVSLGTNARVGTYTLTCITAAANAGTFAVYTPEGFRLADLTVGTAYVGSHLNLTLADGGTDFVVGDRFSVQVAAGSGKMMELDPAAIDGRQRAAGILFADRDATDADIEGTAIVRHAAVILAHLGWPSGISDGAKAAALADLAALHILAR